MWPTEDFWALLRPLQQFLLLLRPGGWFEFDMPALDVKNNPSKELHTEFACKRIPILLD